MSGPDPPFGIQKIISSSGKKEENCSVGSLITDIIR
jgi:hypothetical protein